MNNNRRITMNTNKNIVIEFTDERIIPASGLAVVGALLGMLCMGNENILEMNEYE